jgi:methionyl aminopeptidase
MHLRTKNDQELDTMRRGGIILDSVLREAVRLVSPGVTTRELDQHIHALIIGKGGAPSFLGYRNYPASSCISVNEVIVHGIPGDYVIKDGDIVGIDVGVHFEGYHTDAAVTIPCGRISEDANQLLIVTQQALKQGVEAAIAGNTVNDIGEAVEQFVASNGEFGIVDALSGHGVGKNLQEAPEIMNIATGDTTPLQNGLTLAIEPMITKGTHEVVFERDGWTVRTKDRSLSAQFETTIIVRDNDPEILVPFPLAISVDENMGI